MANCRFCGALLDKFWNCPYGCVGMMEEDERDLATKLREFLKDNVGDEEYAAIDRMSNYDVVDQYSHVLDETADDDLIGDQDPIGDQEPDRDDYNTGGF